MPPKFLVHRPPEPPHEASLFTRLASPPAPRRPTRRPAHGGAMGSAPGEAEGRPEVAPSPTPSAPATSSRRNSSHSPISVRTWGRRFWLAGAAATAVVACGETSAPVAPQSSARRAAKKNQPEPASAPTTPPPPSESWPTESPPWPPFPHRASELFAPQTEMMADDLAFFEHVAAVPLGEPISRTVDDLESARNLGLLPSSHGAPRREADLVSVPIQLRLSALPGVEQIDCIAISSIDRHNGEAPYLYDTLRSVFAAFPEGAQVNVLVGNDDLAYVAPERLQQEIGEARQKAVHIWPSSAAQTRYLREHLPPNRRGGWNYTRALRSYQGTRGLIMMEDDVAWSRGGVERFNALYRERPLPAVSLYNIHCGRLAPQASTRMTELRMDEVDTSHFEFYCLQGMYYHSSITGALGRYVQRRMHTKVYDNVIGFFFTDNRARIGYAYPSIVQHMGQQTSCDSWEFLQSSCYQPAFPQKETF